MTIFMNRSDAGKRLADALSQHGGLEAAVVLALPRGGVRWDLKLQGPSRAARCFRRAKTGSARPRGIGHGSNRVRRRGRLERGCREELHVSKT